MSDSDVKLKVNYQNRLKNLKNIMTNKIIPQIFSIIAAIFYLAASCYAKRKKGLSK